jgi:AraC-like DNA-binding protein
VQDPFLHVYLWPGRIVFVKRGLLSDAHQHMATQAVVASGGTFRVQHGQRGWRRFRGAVWDGRTAHQFDGRDSVQATVYLEPHSAEGRAAETLWRRGGGLHALPAALVDRLAPSVRDLAARPSLAAARTLYETLRSALCADRIPPVADLRIAAAVALMRDALPHSLRLSEVAARLGLSSSRLSHLFAEQVGTPPRPFIPWFRMSEALRRLGETRDLTETAHLAGYSDSAHMSRAFRRWLGLQPRQVASFPNLRIVAE